VAIDNTLHTIDLMIWTPSEDADAALATSSSATATSAVASHPRSAQIEKLTLIALHEIDSEPVHHRAGGVIAASGSRIGAEHGLVSCVGIRSRAWRWSRAVRGDRSLDIGELVERGRGRVRADTRHIEAARAVRRPARLEHLRRREVGHRVVVVPDQRLAEHGERRAV